MKIVCQLGLWGFRSLLNILLIPFILLIPIKGNAQDCPNWTPVQFGNQQGLNDFAIYWSNCTGLDADLHIAGTWTNGSDINDLTALQNLSYVEGDLIIRYNQHLTSLYGLHNLMTVGGDLIIELCTALTDLDGLSSLQSVGGSIFIYANHSLVNVDGLQHITSVPGDVTFYYLNALEHFPDFRNLNTIGGDLRIDDNSMLKHLFGLDSLSHVGGNLIIDSNDSLDSLFSVPKLSEIGGNFELYGNQLTTIKGLDSLRHIGGYFDINYNKRLKSLEGLNNLQTIGGYFIASLQDSLTNLDPLENLHTIGGYLEISDNKSLESIAGLHNLASIDGHIMISSNYGLTSLEGLENIDPETIHAAEGSWNKDLEIFDNSNLSNCAIQSICDLLQIPGVTTDISWNNDGCNSIQEIQDHCNGIQDCSNLMLREFNIYPNPADNCIYVENLSQTKADFLVEVFDPAGRKYLQSSWSKEFPYFSIDVTQIPAGIYQIKISNENQDAVGQVWIVR